MRAPCDELGCDEPNDGRGLCKNHYNTRRLRDIRRGQWKTMYTDAAPVRDHINALRDLGVGLRRLDALTDVPRVTIWHISEGHRARVRQRTAKRILAVPLPIAAHDVASPNACVDATGSRRRIQALAAIGYPNRHQCVLVGLSEGNLSRIFTGAQMKITADRARRIAEMYEQLAVTLGPSEKTRRIARSKGWLPPMAWDADTIDDPSYRQPTPRQPGFVDRYNELREIGVPTQQLAGRLGISTRSLVRQLDRYHLPVPPLLASLVYAERHQSAAAS